MKKLIAVFTCSILLLSCGKGPETIIADSDPLLPSDSESTADQLTEEEPTSAFTHYKLGEFDTIYSLDPLFATSESEMRMIKLIYEGLVQLDPKGELQPAIAKRWEVNVDSTRFTFYLKPDVFFHDSNVFNSGIGRKLKASDIEYVFERMGSVQVPDQPANMFNNIRGFYAYHQEQTRVKDPAKRALNAIDGIEVRNDSTILFVLNKRSGNFIHNLAHPYASIYPRESVQAAKGGPIQNPVGTGQFYLVKKEPTRFILSSNKEYTGSKSQVNRLDIVNGLSESKLFHQFEQGKIDLLIQPSPSVIKTIIGNDGKLKEAYAGAFNFTEAGPSTNYYVYYNPASNQQQEVTQLIQSLQEEQLIEHPSLGKVRFTKTDTSAVYSNTTNRIQVTIANTPCIYPLFLINRVATLSTNYGYSTTMNPSYAVYSNTTFSTRPFPGTIPVIQWTTPLYLMSQNEISGVTFGKYAWNMDLFGLTTLGGS